MGPIPIWSSLNNTVHTVEMCAHTPKLPYLLMGHERLDEEVFQDALRLSHLGRKHKNTFTKRKINCGGCWIIFFILLAMFQIWDSGFWVSLGANIQPTQ